MSFQSDTSDFRSRGIDSDLETCLEYNPQDGYTVQDIEQVKAVWEGQNEGDSWRWVLLLKDGRTLLLIGGCGYTGWDCSSSASSFFGKAATDEFAKQPGNVLVSLAAQYASGKAQTWTEQMNAVFAEVLQLNFSDLDQFKPF